MARIVPIDAGCEADLRLLRDHGQLHGRTLGDVTLENAWRWRQHPAHAVEGMFASRADIARQRGWPVVRRITADDNDRARACYGRLARTTTWNFHELAPPTKHI